MKKQIILTVITFLVFLFMSCNLNKFPKDTIRFTLDGTLVEFTKGYTCYGGVPSITCKDTNGGVLTVLFGSDEETSGYPNEFASMVKEGIISISLCQPSWDRSISWISITE